MKLEFLQGVSAVIVHRVDGKEKPVGYILCLYVLEIELHYFLFPVGKVAIELWLANDPEILTFSNPGTFDRFEVIVSKLVNVRLPVVLTKATVDDSSRSQKVVVRNIC